MKCIYNIFSINIKGSLHSKCKLLQSCDSCRAINRKKIYKSEAPCGRVSDRNTQSCSVRVCARVCVRACVQVCVRACKSVCKS